MADFAMEAPQLEKWFAPGVFSIASWRYFCATNIVAMETEDCRSCEGKFRLVFTRLSLSVGS